MSFLDLLDFLLLDWDCCILAISLERNPAISSYSSELSLLLLLLLLLFFSFFILLALVLGDAELKFEVSFENWLKWGDSKFSIYVEGV